MPEVPNSPDKPILQSSTDSTAAQGMDNGSDEPVKSRDAAVQETLTSDEPAPTDSAEAEWTDDSIQPSQETLKPAGDTAAVKTAATPETSTELSEADWTEGSGYQTSATQAVPDAEKPAKSDDEWGPAYDWQDDLTESVEGATPPTTTQEALAWMQPTWQRLQKVWQRLIFGVRRRIPAAANLSDTVLSAIIVGTLVLLLILLNGVRQPAAASASAPERVSAGKNSAVDVPMQPSAPSSNATASNAAAASNVDGQRIAQIQAQLTDSSILNAQRVIDSVQADFVNNRLTLIVNGDWYRLSQYDQMQLAQALMAQSESLSFADLQLMTADGGVLARSPVVGNNMVILQREPPPEVPIPEKPRYRLMIDR